MHIPSHILSEVRDIFAMLHDGEVAKCTGDRGRLTLEVNCEYLAERINKSFTSFFVECTNIDKLEFHPWMNPSTLPQRIDTEIKAIFNKGLEILAAGIEDDFVKITCNQHNHHFDFCGGSLFLSCQSITIFDQDMNALTITELVKCAGAIGRILAEKKSRVIIKVNPNNQ